METSGTMLQGTMLVWFVLTGASVLFVIWDSLFNGVTSWVQRAAWILVAIYTGPVGAFFYLLTCRRPFPGGHDRFTKATWKQGLNSEMHCLAGDATGIMLAAAVVPILGLANGWDATLEYVAGFVVGLFIFQALMMLGMYGGDYLLAVKKTFFAETVSMNLVMTGMIPVMIILAVWWPESESPLSPEFWFRMSIATMVGGVIAYPMNYWLVANHLKHGCMTLPGADQPAPALGHRSPEESSAHAHHMNHGDHGTAEGNEHMGHEQMSHDHMGMDHSGGHHGMQMGEISTARATAIIVATFAVLFGAVWLTAQFVPVSFALG